MTDGNLSFKNCVGKRDLEKLCLEVIVNSCVLKELFWKTKFICLESVCVKTKYWT